MCTLSLSNVFYHKFSHGVAFYMLNGKNVNVMLESLDNVDCKKWYDNRFNKPLAHTKKVIENIWPIHIKSLRTSVSTVRFLLK